MNYSETEQKVITLVSTALNVNSINLQSSQENTSEWDSLAYLSVISAMEEEFEIEISEKNINNFGSVKNILNEVNHL
ncbi:MAG: phosphopantetheine-binding protein [SAR324 cluster bacterium]|nr:phosphopantetheine-binding protein [SAR324 cluster bacterium]